MAEQKPPPSRNPDAWSSVAEGFYADAEDISGKFVDALFEAAGPVEGKEFLDLGAGPGVVAMEAARRGARVSAIDFAPEMVDLLNDRFDEAGFDGAKAWVATFESMEQFDDDTFATAVSNFGIMFSPDPVEAFSELARVTKTGGRFSMTTWFSPEKFGLFKNIGRAFQEGLPAVEPPGPPIWTRYGDPDVLVEHIEEGGFGDVEVDKVARQWVIPDPVGLVDRLRDVSPGMSFAFEEKLSEDQWEQFSETLKKLLLDQQPDDGSPLELDCTAYLASATL